MKFITLRELHQNTSKILKNLKKEDYVIVTLKGKPYAFMKSINEDEIEELVFKNSKRIKRKIEKALKEIEEGEFISFEELKEEIFE